VFYRDLFQALGQDEQHEHDYDPNNRHCVHIDIKAVDENLYGIFTNRASFEWLDSAKYNADQGEE